MKALVLAKYKELEIAEVPVPGVGPGEALVRVAACGICGSDVHGYDGSSGRRIPPIVMGHEAAGVIAATGSGVTGFAEGDRVTFDSTVCCGDCAYCRREEVNLCDNRQVLGVSCGDYRRAGAFAEFVAVPARIVYRLPDAISFEEAAMLEAVSVAMHGVSLAQDSGAHATGVQGSNAGTKDSWAQSLADATALVVGAGMIGLLITQALRAAGCSRIFVADLDDSRLKLAEEVGAHVTLSAKSDVARQVEKLTGGAGADVALEAVGITESVKASIESVRKGGTVVLVGNIAPEVTIPLQKVVTRQIRVQGSCASAGEYPRAIELMASGAIRVKNLISAIAPLEEGPRWFERLYTREPNLMKVVLTPGETL